MELKGSCIYKIVNLINNKIYIGSTKELSARKSAHITDLRGNRHHSLYLQRAWNKYGEQNFKFEIVESIDSIDSLLIREQFYLDTLNPQYNICPTAGSSLGCKHNPEANLAKSKRMKGKTFLPKDLQLKYKVERKGEGNPHYKIPITEENREIVRQANLGKKRTQAHRDLLAKLMSEKRKGKPSHNKGKKRVINQTTGEIKYI